MCREYYALRKKLEEISRRPAEEMDGAAIEEIKLKMSSHIRSCAVCQENMKWVKGES